MGSVVERWHVSTRCGRIAFSLKSINESSDLGLRQVTVLTVNEAVGVLPAEPDKLVDNRAACSHDRLGPTHAFRNIDNLRNFTGRIAIGIQNINIAGKNFGYKGC